jgi:hypothetical protein
MTTKTDAPVEPSDREQMLAELKAGREKIRREAQRLAVRLEILLDSEERAATHSKRSS